MRNDWSKLRNGFLAIAVGLLLIAGSARAEDEASDGPSRMAQQVTKPEAQALIPLTEPILDELDPDRRFSLGVDRLIRDEFVQLDHKHILVATSRLALDSEGKNLLETLLEARKPIVQRVLIFDDELPQPARSRKLDRVLARHPDVRIFQRTARNFRPTKGMLEGIDRIVIDIPMRGARFYPEVAFMGAVLEEAGLEDIPVLFLDRPLPMSGLLMEGPVGDPKLYDTANCFLPAVPLPGLTGGELADLFNTYYGLEAELEIVEMKNWRRTAGYGPLLEAYARLDIHPEEELSEWPVYAPASTEVAAWQAGAALGPEKYVAGVREENPALLVSPIGYEAEDFARQFNSFGITKHHAEATTTTLSNGRVGDVVAISSDDLPEPVMTSVVIWHLAAQKDAKILPPEGEAGLYGTTFVFDSLRQGRDPREIQRLWKIHQPYREFEARRNDLLRYTR